MDNEEEEKSGGVFGSWFNFTHEENSEHKSTPPHYAFIGILLMLGCGFIGKLCLMSGIVWGFWLSFIVSMIIGNLTFN